MERLSMCRICRMEDIRMVLIANTHLQETYEKLTVTPFESDDSRPVQVCFICHARLQNSYQLMINCLQSEQLFTELLRNNMVKPLKWHINSNALEIMKVIQFDTLSEQTDEDEIMKTEDLKEFDHVEVKLEESEAKNETLEQYERNLEDNIQSTDSEDDIPLKLIKNENKRRLKRKKGVTARREKAEEVKTSFKVDASEIILNKDEQISNLIARSKTQSYINSPYKCEMCYKGFVGTKAYENHKIKHEERSGSHVCEICSMRYHSVQLLRTHVVTAHSRLYRCNKCGTITHTANQARVHEKWHSGFTYECQLCGHKFRKPTSYLSHMRKRHPTEHVCLICGESFVSNHGLQMHRSKTHRNDVILKESSDGPDTNKFCKDCNIQFITSEAWKRHILFSVKHTVKNKNGTQCQICGWRGENASLSTHIRAHVRALKGSGNRASTGANYRCTQCGENFVTRSKLQAHVNRMHLGLKYNKNIVCEICGKHCTSNATLKYHQRTHTGERPYNCSVCSKQFIDSNQLRIHNRTHTGEKPYACEVCDKKFSQKPALNRHYRVHTGDKPYECIYCARTFSQSNSLKLHVRTVHLKLPTNPRKKILEEKTSDKQKNDKKLNDIAQETVS